MTATLQNINSRLGFFNLNFSTNFADLFERISSKHINTAVRHCISITLFINTCIRMEYYIPSCGCCFFIPNTDSFSTTNPFAPSESGSKAGNTDKKQENASRNDATRILHSENVSCKAVAKFLHLEIVSHKATTRFLLSENAPCNAAAAILRFERAFYTVLVRLHSEIK